VSDEEAEFRRFVSAQLEPLPGLAYLTCGDWQVAEDAVLSAHGPRHAPRWRGPFLDRPVDIDTTLLTQ
jgi:hypothetical protein